MYIGTTLSHALPSAVSISRPGGTTGRTASTGTGQLAKSRSSHRCPITHRPGGVGIGDASR